MKDSGIDWIGKIPDEWEIEKGKRIFAQRNERGNTINLELLSPTQKYGVIPQTLYEELTTYSAVKLKEGTDLSQLKTVHKGDYCISLRSFQGGFEYSKYEGVVSPAYQIFYAIKNIDECYYKYLFKDQTFIAKMNSFTMSLRDGKNISFSDFGNTYIPFPPLSEQTKIAGFLDKKCSEIDSIIEESKNSIEEYKAWKQSVIFEAVTGKNLSCKKKNSGIEWLGEIPETWEVRALKTIFRIFSGTTPKSDRTEYWDGNIKWITPADFKTEDVYVENGKRNISENGFSDCSLELIPINNLIFSKRAPIGKVCINKNEMCTNQGCLACVKKINLSIKFFYYLLSSLTEYFEVLGSGTTFNEISLTSFSDFKVLFPPLSEQTKIAGFLDEKCAQIDSLISEKQLLIKDLAEYKKSLIFEAVTGKRRV
ncbi:restriction endonuclease subunit S [uncultured Treponema sp.]|uniref:restriction endonuclease subunit S n=1 Tax=uncultured Treponema sp. TaxID=162155 RepID=UPI0025EE1655|nr:restriction endonuclease subunit S [uncultured Treponema sp.]